MNKHAAEEWLSKDIDAAFAVLLGELKETDVGKALNLSSIPSIDVSRAAKKAAEELLKHTPAKNAPKGKATNGKPK